MKITPIVLATLALALAACGGTAEAPALSAQLDSIDAQVARGAMTAEQGQAAKMQAQMTLFGSPVVIDISALRMLDGMMDFSFDGLARDIQEQDVENMQREVERLKNLQRALQAAQAALSEAQQRAIKAVQDNIARGGPN